MAKKYPGTSGSQDPYAGISRYRRNSIIILILVIIGFTVYTRYNQKDLIYVTPQESGLLIRSNDEDEIIVDYEDLVSVYYLEEFDVGSVVDGQETSKICTGTWSNAEWVSYKLYYLKKAQSAIVLTTAADEVIVFNYESKDVTEALYESFSTFLEEKGFDDIRFGSASEDISAESFTEGVTEAEMTAEQAATE